VKFVAFLKFIISDSAQNLSLQILLSGYIYIYSPSKMIMLKYVENDQYYSEKYVRNKVKELKKCT